jgi:hypothetical protein
VKNQNAKYPQNPGRCALAGFGFAERYLQFFGDIAPPAIIRCTRLAPSRLLGAPNALASPRLARLALTAMTDESIMLDEPHSIEPAPAPHAQPAPSTR